MYHTSLKRQNGEEILVCFSYKPGRGPCYDTEYGHWLVGEPPTFSVLYVVDKNGYEKKLSEDEIKEVENQASNTSYLDGARLLDENF